MHRTGGEEKDFESALVSLVLSFVLSRVGVCVCVRVFTLFACARPSPLFFARVKRHDARVVLSS